MKKFEGHGYFFKCIVQEAEKFKVKLDKSRTALSVNPLVFQVHNVEGPVIVQVHTKSQSVIIPTATKALARPLGRGSK